MIILMCDVKFVFFLQLQHTAVSNRYHLTTHFQCGGSTRHIDRHIHTSVVFFIRVRFWGNVFQIFAATKFRVDGTKWKKGTRHWCVLSVAGKSHTTSRAAVLEFERSALRKGKEDSVSTPNWSGTGCMYKWFGVLQLVVFCTQLLHSTECNILYPRWWHCPSFYTSSYRCSCT
jgi:hypothetical protein